MLLGNWALARNDLMAAIAILTAADEDAEALRCTQLQCEILTRKSTLDPTIDNIKELQQHCTLGFTLLETLKAGYASNSDKQKLMARSYKLFEMALTAQSLSKKRMDHEVIFSLMEQSKNSLLYESWLKGKAEDQASANSTLLSREKDLRRQILFLKEEIAQAEDQENSSAQQLHDRLFQLNQRHREILQKLKESDPLYQLAHSGETQTLSEAQASLSSKQGMLSYFVGDSSLFILLIKKHQVQLFSWKTPADLKEKVDQMRGGIYQPYLPDFVKKGEYNSEDYEAAAHYLYEKLLEPLRNDLPEQLIILPDGPLADLPFAALLTNEQSDSYLIRQYQISYAWSASLRIAMRQRNQELDPFKDHILAMAPAFSEQKMDSSIALNSYQRSFLGPLPFSGVEVNALAENFETEIYLGKEANMKTFLEKAEDFRILHLSTHGKADRENPDFSFLAFDLSTDQKLYLSQLYLLRLQAEMVVLSACETGTGTSFRGEGIYSLARGFTAAGAGSLVSTLWQVNDQLSATLMQRFYEGLAAGKAKDEALRDAQLSLIQEGESPFYWAGFTLIGDERELGGDSPRWNFKPFFKLLFVVLLFILIIVILIRTGAAAIF